MSCVADLWAAYLIGYGVCVPSCVHFCLRGRVGTVNLSPMFKENKSQEDQGT